MQNLEEVFSSSSQYQQAFEKGLVDILKHQTAGTFILACANIFQHEKLLKANKEHLFETYNTIAQYYQSCKDDNITPQDSIDDAAVINNIIELGFENLDPILSRNILHSSCSFTLNYNQLRSFRPARMSGVKQTEIDLPFNNDGFHFDKAFLKKETFAEGEYQGLRISLLYNKFPFVDYHAILVIDKALHNNQFLTEHYLNSIYQLLSKIQTQLPELVIAYNSLGAGASVNHLHFQLFLETTPLSIFSDKIDLNGGSEAYPIPCMIFNHADTCWSQLEKLHSSNTPYNLIFKNNRIYCFHRRPADIKFTDIDVSMYGWAEMAGIFTITNKQIFNNVSAEHLIKTLKAVTC